MEAVLEKPKEKKKKKLKTKDNLPNTETNPDHSKSEVIEKGEASKIEEKPLPDTNETRIENEESVQESARTEEIEIASTDDFQRLLNSNKELLTTLKIDEINNQKAVQLAQNVVKLKQESINLEVAIKPYTESQLSALYTNSELQTIELFTEQYIEAELRGLATKQHHLFELLNNYLTVREKITVNTLELDQLRLEYRELQSQLWSIFPAVVSGKGECQDGTTVTATHTYNKSVFHRAIFQSIVRILNSVQKLTYENHILYAYSAEELRLQIELFLQTIISNCMMVTNLERTAEVSLSLQAEPLHIKPYLSDLRLCISVIFYFQRKLIRDKQFIKETREWLSRLVAVLLRLANHQDHLFIISHILRCPAGVGNWGSSFIQTPLILPSNQSPFANYQINHIITILAMILMPVKEREKFLEEIAQTGDTATEALWVMVDSDGEEDEESSGTSLRENDLVALLNQLPIDNLFRALLLVQRRNNQDEYNINLMDENHLLRFFAFSTILLHILNRGLQTYAQPRYKQFSKRLSRFIRHVTQYATDQWEVFKKYKSIDTAMFERLSIEYDSFFLRAIYYLYSAQKLGAWQFLAVIPYHLVSIKTLWKIFYFLHTNEPESISHILDPLCLEDFNKKLWEQELRSQFEERINSFEDAEAYYLLNTFTNMALAREAEDMEFIFAATMDLLQIGFISEATQETCSKSARILLTHLTSKHPHLLSNVLKKVKDNIDKIQELSLYLYEELPLSIWNILDEDLEVIARLLLSSASNSIESKLARMILSRLNWDSVPYEKHCEVALLVVQAADQEPNYLQWAWQTILRLKLHINDKLFVELSKVQEVERYDILMKGIREQKPLASFVTVLMTTWGHLVPLICIKGLNQLLFLQTHQKHEAVLFALYLIVPIFLDSQECLINNEKFQEILLNLLNADRGYISMAKSLIGAQSTVLQQFGNMIETQIVNFSFYGLDNPKYLVRLWINSLVSIPNWNKDFGIMFLLDVILRACFFHLDALDAACNILRDLQQNATPQENTGTISSLFKWVSSGNSNGSLIISSLSNYTWLGYIMILIEHEDRELRSGLWKELLLQLSKQKGKVSVDLALKKAAGIVKTGSVSSASLCIYRWAQQAMDTSLNHPLLPLLWQKFFNLYLARINSTTIERCCVGEKFFDGLVNFTFFKKIKRKLQETVDYYQAKIDLKDEDNDELDKKPFHQNLLKVFRAFLLWLEEPRLQENNLLLASLPPQYEPALLGLILQGSNAPWYEFLDQEQMKKDQNLAVKIWRTSNFREKTNVNKPLPNPGQQMESADPIERILRRLKSYDAPKGPPAIVSSAPVIAPLNFGSKDDMFKSLDHSFKTLKQFAHNHTLKVSEHKALDCSYQELIPQLYRSVLNKVKKKVPCKGRNQTVHCSGAAIVVLEMEEARVNERINHQIETNRNAYDALLAKNLQPPAVSLCTASVTLQQAVRILQQQVRCHPATAELGVELFYYILSLLSEETTNYLPTKTLFSTCLEKLGQSHICEVENEMPKLLQTILKEPHLGEYLAKHFSPSNVSTDNLLKMYATITEEVGRKYDIAFALLSKFEVENWLKLKQPKIKERSFFIRSVIKALSGLGMEPIIEALMLHGLYKKHLLTLFEFEFPEHYGEVLVQVLKGSNGSDPNLLALSVWMDILNSLAKPVKMSLKVPLREQLRQYAQVQGMLHHQEIIETAALLARHFTQERLQYGLYGLYPKCRNYMDVFVLFLGMVGHGLVVSSLSTHQGMLDDKMCEKIWPHLRDMFTPWLVPYSMQNLKENMASWIQQLADDRSILLPWIPADGAYAQKMVHVFFECIQFIIITLPACNSILSFLWQWYVGSFAHIAVKDHILHPIHHTFVLLPWHNFWPSLTDLDFMLRVVDQYLPECHAFLGHVFMTIQWANWLNNVNNIPLQTRSRILQCFINLLVKLTNEPNVRNRQPEKAKALLVQSENFDWSSLDPSVFQHVLDWYVMSCDSAVIFKSDPIDLDYRVFHFLRVVSGFNRPLKEPSMEEVTKRIGYVKAFVKLISVYSSRHKSTMYSKETELFSVITRHLNEIESNVLSEAEMVILLREICYVLNISTIVQVTDRCFQQWISNKPGNGLIIKVLMKVLGEVVTDLEVLGRLLETTISSYFQNTVSEEFDPSWREVAELLNVLAVKQNELEKELLGKGLILTLNALLVQRISKGCDSESLLNTCMDWMEGIKVNESNESKVPLLWSGLLMIALQHCDKDEACTGSILSKFAQGLNSISEDKGAGGWGRGLLNIVGIGKQGISMDFRFLCRALAGYILAQLPNMKGEPQIVRRTPNAAAKVGQPGGNTDCVKILMKLDFGQSQGKIKDCAELALKQIQDANNSLHNARSFLILLVKQFYLKPYLKDIG